MVCYHGLPIKKYLLPGSQIGIFWQHKLGFFTTKDVVFYVYIIDMCIHCCNVVFVHNHLLDGWQLCPTKTIKTSLFGQVLPYVFICGVLIPIQNEFVSGFTTNNRGVSSALRHIDYFWSLWAWGLRKERRSMGRCYTVQRCLSLFFMLAFYIFVTPSLGVFTSWPTDFIPEIYPTDPGIPGKKWGFAKKTVLWS